MKANQFRIKVKPEDGTIWITHQPYRGKEVGLKDVTDDILLCLCADLSAHEGEGAQRIERSVKFSDDMNCRIVIDLVKRSGGEEVEPLEDDMVEYRVWADGTEQEVEPHVGPYVWMSDDFEIVKRKAE